MIEVTITRKQAEAEGIFSFELACAQGGHLPPFSAGAHIDVHLPNGQVRQYSLCNNPDERHRYLIAVLLDPSSRGGSRALHERVEEGTTLRISEPRNLFPLEAGARRSLLFAGGIGITPILCMAERLAMSGAAFELHYCCRTLARTAFVERLGDSGFSEQVVFHFDDQGQNHRSGISRVLASYSAGDHLYVCGPGGFMNYLLDEARQAGWPEHSLHREYFAAQPQAESQQGAFEIQLASDGRCLPVPADRSVAEVLLEAGIDLPLSCEQGICGTCLTRVLEGTPDHRDMFLTPDEQAKNDQFTPCCSRSKSARLVLDL